MYTHNYLKEISSPHSYKKKNFLLNIRMVNQGLNLSLNELRLTAEHKNISKRFDKENKLINHKFNYENKSAKDLIKALRRSRLRLGIKKIS